MKTKYPYFSEVPKYIEQGLITKRSNDTDDLFIYNYTVRCAYERTWNDITRSCRGLVLDKEGYIIARPFRKFFNLGEEPETREFPLNQPYTITEKVDGSLGVLFNYNNCLTITTRGSFDSEQAVWARKFIRDNAWRNKWFDIDYTYLFEIIYKDNKIIVDYDFEGLVLLSMIETATGKELDYQEVVAEAKRLQIPVVKSIECTDLNSLTESMNIINPLEIEGYVIRFPKLDLRIKIKGEKYLQLARIISNLTPLAAWENIKGGKVDTKFKEMVPEEFRSSFEEICNALERQYESLNRKYCALYNLIPMYLKSSQKEFALWVQKERVGDEWAMFNLLKGQSIDYGIMKKIKPKANKLREEDV